ncbi:helix-turn-helix transcriptional regulator [Spongiibacter nanhainus]|uniref:Helix-turn-helix transcriptional regulator n=1 Tax=Spongiibacter nanhainus TaxID=2794344 RepID=A0A7T4URP6_9GAMM|nr:helix-turn-helix transcriptional regulator [Spongiibacter nanhainus]QQD18590.1 helix-turn-helix transcriptional regulator [Spongiibacter nanhainus]
MAELQKTTNVSRAEGVFDSCNATIATMYEGLLGPSPVNQLLRTLLAEFRAESVCLLVSSKLLDRNNKLFRIESADANSLEDSSYRDGSTKCFSGGDVVDLRDTRMANTASLEYDEQWVSANYRPRGPGASSSFLVDSRVDFRSELWFFRRQELSGNEFARLECYRPHLAQFLELGKKVDTLRVERDVYSCVADNMLLSSFFLNARGEVVALNRNAQDLVQREREVDLSDGNIRLSDHVADAKLNSIIGRAVAGSGPGAEKVPSVQVLRVAREKDYSDLQFVVKSLRTSSPGLGNGYAAVVFACDTELCATAPIRALCELFGFTKAEARVAMLLTDGLDIDEIKCLLDIERNTVRSHIRSIFSKTGVNRQALVVRLVLKSVAQFA